MADSGWFKLYYKLRDSDLWLSEKFTRGQAWVDLLMLARWKEEPGFMRKRGCKIQINQGQVAWSEKGLADRWGWSRGKVRRFLSELEAEAQIEQQKTNITTVINITNFNKYQGNSTAKETPNRTANGHQIEQQTDTKEEGKKEKNIKKKSVDNRDAQSTPSPNPRDELSELFLNENVRTLIEQAIERVHLTRKSGKAQPSVISRFVRDLRQYDDWKVGTGLTLYLEGDYHLDNKGERYALGIVRNATAKDWQKVVGGLQKKEPRQDGQGGVGQIQPRNYKEAKDAERRSRAMRLLQTQQEGEDAKQGNDTAGIGQADNSLPVSGTG